MPEFTITESTSPVSGSYRTWNFNTEKIKKSNSKRLIKKKMKRIDVFYVWNTVCLEGEEPRDNCWVTGDPLSICKWE